MRTINRNQRQAKKLLKKYNSPILKEFGTIKDVTSGAGGSVADGGSAGQRPFR